MQTRLWPCISLGIKKSQWPCITIEFNIPRNLVQSKWTLIGKTNLNLARFFLQPENYFKHFHPINIIIYRLCSVEGAITVKFSAWPWIRRAYNRLMNLYHHDDSWWWKILSTFQPIFYRQTLDILMTKYNRISGLKNSIRALQHVHSSTGKCWQISEVWVPPISSGI